MLQFQASQHRLCVANNSGIVALINIDDGACIVQHDTACGAACYLHFSSFALINTKHASKHDIKADHHTDCLYVGTTEGSIICYSSLTGAYLYTHDTHVRDTQDKNEPPASVCFIHTLTATVKKQADDDSTAKSKKKHKRDDDDDDDAHDDDDSKCTIIPYIVTVSGRYIELLDTGVSDFDDDSSSV